MEAIAPSSEAPAPAARTRGRLRGTAVCLAWLLVGLYFGMGAAVAWQTVRAKPVHLIASPKQLKLGYDDVTFRSIDGTRLSGWLVWPSPPNPLSQEQERGSNVTARVTSSPSPVLGGRGPGLGAPRALVVLCHGVDSNRTAMLQKAGLLARLDCASLLFDFRARGESGGERCTLGYRETEDALAAIHFAEARPELKGVPLIIEGESMGGAVAIMAGARAPEVRAVIAESPFARMDHAVDNHFRSLLGVAGPLFAWPARLAGERLIGCSCAEVSPLADIARIAPRPVLLIQDADDRLCPPSETATLMSAARGPVELWTLPGAGHVMAQSADPVGFAAHVTNFLDRSLAWKEAR